MGRVTFVGGGVRVRFPPFFSKQRPCKKNLPIRLFVVLGVTILRRLESLRNL